MIPFVRSVPEPRRLHRKTKTPEKHDCKCGDNFVTKEQFKALEGKFDEIKGIVDGIKAKPSKLTKEKDEE